MFGNNAEEPTNQISFDGGVGVVTEAGKDGKEANNGNPFENYQLNLEEQTEEEAIELIQGLQGQIADLRQQLTQRDQEMSQLKLAQSDQIVTYKSQIENLTRQIELFERKFEQMDQDRLQMSKRTAQITQENIAKIRHLEAEKDSMIVELQEQVLTLKQQQKTTEKRFQDCRREAKEVKKELREKNEKHMEADEQLKELSEQVTTLQTQNENLRTLLQSKEDECEQMLRDYGKELEQSQQVQREMEGRMQGVSQALQMKNEEVVGYQSTLTGIEQMQKKAKYEVEKVKKERDDFKKQRDECFKTQLPQMEQKLQAQRDEIKNLQKEVDKLKSKLRFADKEKNEALRGQEDVKAAFKQIKDKVKEDVRQQKRLAREKMAKKKKELSVEMLGGQHEEHSEALPLNSEYEVDKESRDGDCEESDDEDALGLSSSTDPINAIASRLNHLSRLEQEQKEFQKKIEAKDKKFKKLKEDTAAQLEQTAQLFNLIVRNCQKFESQEVVGKVNTKSSSQSEQKSQFGSRRASLGHPSSSDSTATNSKSNTLQSGKKVVPGSKKKTVKKDIPIKQSASKGKKQVDPDLESQYQTDALADDLQSEQEGAQLDIGALTKKYPKVNQQTLEACINASEQMKLVFQLLKQQNSELQHQIGKIQDDNENEKRYSEEQAMTQESVLNLQTENRKLKRKTDFLINTLNQLHARYNKLSLQAFNQLHNIKFKFQNNERITAQVNFERVNQIAQEIQGLHSASEYGPTHFGDSRQGALLLDDAEEPNSEANWQRAWRDEFQHLLDIDQSGAARDAQVLELVSVLSEVTNILHFDLKCLELKNSQIEELKSRVGEVERNKINEHELFKQRISEDIAEVKREYEQKFAMYQRQQTDYESQIQEMRSQNGELLNRESDALNQVQLQEQEITRLRESIKNFKDTIAALERQSIDTVEECIQSRKTIASLVIQKNVLRVKLLCLERNSASTVKALNYLTTKYMSNEQKANAAALMDQIQLEKLKAGLNEQIKQPLLILRFRRAVISIMFANRMARAGREGSRKLQRNQPVIDYELINSLKSGLQMLVEHYAKNINQEKIDKIISQLDKAEDFSIGPISTQRTGSSNDRDVSPLEDEQRRLQSQLVMLVCVLNPRDSFNRHLFCLEDQLDQYSGLHKQLEASHRLLITQLNQKVTERDLKTQKMQEALQALTQVQEQTEKKLNDKQKSYESMHLKYKKKKEEFKAIKYELQNETVPIEEFQRVQECNEQLRSVQKELSSKVEAMETRIKQSKHEFDQLQANKTHFEESFQQHEQTIEELNQKIFIKEEKINSLETLLQLRDKSEQTQMSETMQRLEQLMQLQAQDKAQIATLQLSLDKLNQEKQKLLKDNMLLLQVNNEVKQKVMDIEQKLEQDHQQKLNDKTNVEKEMQEMKETYEKKLTEVQNELVKLENEKSKVIQKLEEKKEENSKLAEALEKLTSKLEEGQKVQEAMMLSESQINRSITQAEQVMQQNLQINPQIPQSLNQQVIGRNFESQPSQQIQLPPHNAGYSSLNMHFNPTNNQAPVMKVNSLTSVDSHASQPAAPGRVSKLQSLVPGRIMRRNTGRNNSGASSALGTQRSLSRGATNQHQAQQQLPQPLYGVAYPQPVESPSNMVNQSQGYPSFQQNQLVPDLDTPIGHIAFSSTSPIPASVINSGQPAFQDKQLGQVQILPHGMSQATSQSALDIVDIGQRLDTDPAERSLDLSATQKSMLEKQVLGENLQKEAPN